MKFNVTEVEFDFDDDGEIDGEGYVMWNRWGIYKLVNRYLFSRLYFLTNNNWVSS